MNLDWTAIRALGGSHAAGFEELCSQLARSENAHYVGFERKGTPDGGVECFATLSDGSEWGWQAKYFHEVLGDSQWAQIDESVGSALEKHPRLSRFYVCIARDLPDARIKGQKSARNRWSERVAKWRSWAQARGMSVEFVLWGSSELIERLSTPSQRGRLQFWFDVQVLDGRWFEQRLAEALKAAGPRYTPELHQKLPLAADFEAFGRTAFLEQQIKAAARPLRETMRRLGYEVKQQTPQQLIEIHQILVSNMQKALSAFSELSIEPIGTLRDLRLLPELEACLANAELLRDRSFEAGDEINQPSVTGANAAHSSLSGLAHAAGSTCIALRNAKETIARAFAIADSGLAVLSGDAGTGKTHLFCDVASRRVTGQKPTVLVMGQQLMSSEDPWVQVMNQIGLTTRTPDEFLGALEAAAQASNHRALILIDALNEGAGRNIWPQHLAAFLARIHQSPWIGVALSIRTGYQRSTIPEDVCEAATALHHHGFNGQEYDAARSFFLHYELEFPSTPLLTPEFSNPLFLKTICRGLHEMGHTRLPRGHHGISTIFGWYLDGINQRLARQLDFDVKLNLVSRALESLARIHAADGKRWTSIEKARDVIEALLPGRTFSQSLFPALVNEGLLIEMMNPGKSATAPTEIVLIAYERLGDHMVVRHLLDAHLDSVHPEEAFSKNAPLAFLWNKQRHVPQGLHEAMHIQVAERCGKELLDLAPQLKDHWYTPEAFRGSVLWRKESAVTLQTRKVLAAVTRNMSELQSTFEMLLTVASLPRHALNAEYLDRLLRNWPMAKRDARWGISLHGLWGNNGALERLLDWAMKLTSATTVDPEVVDLCANALAWTLGTSNRFLRDRATKALVALLTDRLVATERLVNKFSDVDDMYVLERVYAVAYGVAMRSRDSVGVEQLGVTVYYLVFAERSPPRHLLLRDYARGVVERALIVNPSLEVKHQWIRPPYRSSWPTIPTVKEIEHLKPRFEGGKFVDDHAWAQHRIWSSVMDDDFARYVIGTNSHSTNWLSIPLSEPRWLSLEERTELLERALSGASLTAWNELRAANEEAAEERMKQWKFVTSSDMRTIRPTIEEALPDISKVDRRRRIKAISIKIIPTARQEAARCALFSALGAEQAASAKPIVDALIDRGLAEQPPKFDLTKIQHYVLQRVFELGWAPELFGEFDQNHLRSRGREAGKAERIGKKYQWLAYHEIHALIADHFQYREGYSTSHLDTIYDGPWQDRFRDIDPSCMLSSKAGGSSWDGHARAWWCAAEYDHWGAEDAVEWAAATEDLPSVPDILFSTAPKGARWVTLDGHFTWVRPVPADIESDAVERRDVWIDCRAYLIRSVDNKAFERWARRADAAEAFPSSDHSNYKIFLGEHGWSNASRYFQHPYHGDDGWSSVSDKCPVKLHPVAFRYTREQGSFDCSMENSFTLRLPHRELVACMEIRWTGNNADFADAKGDLIAFDPTVENVGPDALLIDRSALSAYLAREELSLIWVVTGEKRAVGPGMGYRHFGSLSFSGIYRFIDGKAVGSLKSEFTKGDSRD